MDAITAAIVVALANLSKDVIKDSYNALKSAISQKLGSKSDVVDAIDRLEKKPDSEGRKATVREEVELAKVNEDPEIVRLAQDLLEQLKDTPEGQQVITQNVSQVKYAATSATGNASIGNITEGSVSE